MNVTITDLYSADYDDGEYQIYIPQQLQQFRQLTTDHTDSKKINWYIQRDIQTMTAFVNNVEHL